MVSFSGRQPSQVQAPAPRDAAAFMPQLQDSTQRNSIYQDKTIYAAELSLRIPNLSVEADKISSSTVATSEVRAKTWVKDSSKLWTVVLPKKKRTSKIRLKEPRCLKSKKPPMKQYFDDQGINASTVSNSLTKLKNSPFRKLT